MVNKCTIVTILLMPRHYALSMNREKKPSRVQSAKVRFHQERESMEYNKETEKLQLEMVTGH